MTPSPQQGKVENIPANNSTYSTRQFKYIYVYINRQDNLQFNFVFSVYAYKKGMPFPCSNFITSLSKCCGCNNNFRGYNVSTEVNCFS